MLQQDGLGRPSSLDTAEARGVPSRAAESARSDEGGYRMIEAINIENFRCFDEVHLDDLKNVNLIVGRNASGKTALLEALYFTLGGPALSFKLRQWRGLGSTVQYNEYTASRNAVWRDLFHNFEQKQTVKIQFQATGELARTVEISCFKKETHVVRRGKGHDIAQITEIPPIVFKYLIGGKTYVVKPDFSGETIVLANSPEPARGTFFPSNIMIDPIETANHFSNLSKENKIEAVITALRELFPSIEGLSLEMEANRPMIHVGLKGRNEKVPVGLVSNGISKLVAFLVAIADQPGGVIIVDEIENGFYFSTMPEIWRVLRKFCKDHDVQLFPSTHSAECLSALQPAIKEFPDDFSLLRTTREASRSVVKHFQGDEFLAGLEENFEIR
jgi:hypothetical protein